MYKNRENVNLGMHWNSNKNERGFYDVNYKLKNLILY